MPMELRDQITDGCDIDLVGHKVLLHLSRNRRGFQNQTTLVRLGKVRDLSKIGKGRNQHNPGVAALLEEKNTGQR